MTKKEMENTKKSKRGLADTILLSLMIAFFAIAMHQTMTIAKTEGLKMGFFKSYWLFMLGLICLMIKVMRKNKQVNNTNKKG